MSRAAATARCRQLGQPALVSLRARGWWTGSGVSSAAWEPLACVLVLSGHPPFVFCRRTDELVDGPNASRITPAVSVLPLQRARSCPGWAPAQSPTAALILIWLQALDRWENRLEALFEGRPYDALDAALTDTVARFPVHIQPFRHAGCFAQACWLPCRRACWHGAPNLCQRWLTWPDLLALLQGHDWRHAHGSGQVAVSSWLGMWMCLGVVRWWQKGWVLGGDALLLADCRLCCTTSDQVAVPNLLRPLQVPDL